MKKIFALICMLGIMLGVQTAYAANYVFETDFDSCDALPSNEYVSFAAGKLGTDDGNKYLDLDREDKVQIKFSTLPDKLLVYQADFWCTNPSAEQFQLWGVPSSGSWLKIGHFYNNVTADKAKHSLLLEFDPVNKKIKMIVDGQKLVDSSFSADFDWLASGAALIISGYHMRFDNIKAAYNDISGMFGMDSIKFNDIEAAEKSGSFGSLSKSLNKVSVKFNYPIDDRTIAPVVFKNGDTVMDTSFVYNSETGYYDFTINEELTGGESLTMSIAEEPEALFGKKEYTFKIAEEDYSFTQMKISSGSGKTRADITLSNGSFDKCGAAVFIFVYAADGSMADCIAGETVTIKPMQSAALYAELPAEYDESYTVEAYVWDNAESAIPLLSIS